MMYGRLNKILFDVKESLSLSYLKKTLWQWYIIYFNLHLYLFEMYY